MKNVLKSLLFIIILFILVESIIFYLIPTKGFRRYSLYEKAAFDIITEPRDTVDVIALGDSLIYTSINPMQIWHDYGFTVYDCAKPAYFMKDAYEHLSVAIEHHHPKIVLMETNMLFRNVNNYPWANKIGRKLNNIAPISKYHNNWKNLFSTKEVGTKNSFKGYNYITTTKPSTNYNYMGSSNKVREIPEDNLYYIKKIIELCKENNIKFIFVSTPSQTSCNAARRNASLKLSSEMEVDFLDLNVDEKVDIDWTKETKDKGSHLNYLGAIKVSKYLGSYLNNLNILKDHRGDSKYDLWDEAYNKYILESK